MDLEHLAPTVRIVCRNYSETPQYGLHKWDCPNLLWELMRCRRQKLTAQQLLTRNTSEAIVDKDNHAIDAMKYQLMSHPEPSRKPLDRRVAERLAEMQKIDPTAASARYFRTLGEEGEEEEPKVSFYTRNARRLIWEWERRRGWRR